MSKNNILIAEDEDRLRLIINEYLKDEGYNVYEATNGEEALSIFKNKSIDLAIIDIMMPKIDGWKLCETIRAISDIPIIIITARSDEDDKLMGFELGADDYVTKPFSVRVLMARVSVLIKRSKPGILGDKDIILANGLMIDTRAYVAKLNEIDLQLTPREYEILLYLIRHRGSALSRQQLLDQIWGYDYYGSTRIVDAHIKKLRKKLGEYGEYIKTVLGVGYKYED